MISKGEKECKQMEREADPDQDPIRVTTACDRDEGMDCFSPRVAILCFSLSLNI